MSDKVQFDLGSEFENPRYKSCFARSVSVNPHHKESKYLDYQQPKSENEQVGGHLKKPFAPSRSFSPEIQGQEVRLRKNPRINFDEVRRYSCSIMGVRRTSLCSDRKSELVENIATQSKLKTLEWQMREVQKSRDMYRAMMNQVVTYLEKAHHSLELLGSRMNRRHSVNRSKSEHQIEPNRGCPDSSPQHSQQVLNRTFDEHQLRDFQWQQNKAEEPTPEEIPPDKLAKEAFRLLRTAQSLLNTREPDLAQNGNPENDIDFLAQLAKEFPPPEHKPQRTTSFSLSPKLIQPEAEMKISTAFNRKLSLQLCDSRRNTKVFRNVDSARGSVAESDSEFVTDNGVFFNQKSKSEKSSSPANGSISSVEDESGFSSMNSFQEVGLPLVNSTMTEEVSTKNALLRSMLHNNSDYSSLSISLNRESVMKTTVHNENSDKQEQKRNIDDVKLWEKPPSLPPTTPQHQRWFSSPTEETACTSMKVLWV